MGLKWGASSSGPLPSSRSFFLFFFFFIPASASRRHRRSHSRWFTLGFLWRWSEAKRTEVFFTALCFQIYDWVFKPNHWQTLCPVMLYMSCLSSVLVYMHCRFKLPVHNCGTSVPHLHTYMYMEYISTYIYILYFCTPIIYSTNDTLRRIYFLKYIFFIIFEHMCSVYVYMYVCMYVWFKKYIQNYRSLIWSECLCDLLLHNDSFSI